MKPEFVNSTVTFLVGLVALLVYWLNKRNEKRNAATIIIMDIRHAEQVVLSILDKGTVDIWTNEILSENNWSKYKHLFASDLSYDDFSAFNRFFDACIEMSDARKRMREIFYSSINEKAKILQNKIFDIKDLNSPEGLALKKKVIDEINTEIYVFDPNEPRERMFKNLQLMGRLSSTIAFERLKQQAKM